MDIATRCIIVAVITPKPGHTEALKAVLEPIIEEVHREPGCEFYALHQDAEGRLVFVEGWESRELWQDHMGYDTVARIRSGMEEHLDKPVELYEVYGNEKSGAKGIIPLGN